MSFRLDLSRQTQRVVLRAEGNLRGVEAASMLREQIATAMNLAPQVVLNLACVDGYDERVLSVIEAALGVGVVVEGGGAFFDTLIQRF